MSEEPVPEGPRKLDAELAGYPPTALTVRVIQAILAVIPGAGALPPYTNLDGAAAAVFGGIPEDILAQARVLVQDPRVDQALFAARSIDTGDTGLTIVSGVRSALALFFGSREGRSSALAQQQRTDAALKATALAYLLTRLVPLPPADRVELVLSVPAGRELVTYYGAIEIAVPFASEVEAKQGRFVQDLMRDQGGAIPDRLLGIVGRQGMADAQEMLIHLVGELDRSALAAAPHTVALAERIRSILPYAAASGDLFDLVAAGADALPCYRYLTARLAVEVSLALAKHAQMPDVPLPKAATVVPAATTPTPPPIPDVLKVAQVVAAEPEPEPEAATDVAHADALIPADDDIPAPPSDVIWPTAPLPEEHRLRGVYLSEVDGTAQWRVFTAEGVFTDGPPAVPEGMDWNAHRALGHRVATYRRDGDTVRITDPDGATSVHPCARDATSITIDGRAWRRSDWDLSGRTVAGVWTNDATETLVLGIDGRVSRGERVGTYVLGVGRVVFSWDRGPASTATWFSDLRPSSRRPSVLWVGGERWGWVGETTG